MADMDDKHLRLTNKVDELKRLNIFLEELAEEWNIPLKTIHQINLVLEEIVSNIIFYAFDDKEEHDILLGLQIEQDAMKITVTDSGKAFDLLSAETYEEKEKTADERHIGGLGIHFVKELMDQVEYERNNDQNILTLYKKLPS
jgi:anti-sigma regulatory factor (Ser/Thr protein kinase)